MIARRTPLAPAATWTRSTTPVRRPQGDMPPAAMAFPRPSAPRRRPNPSTRVPEDTRALVYARDGHACVLCGWQLNLTLQHRRARSMGGSRREDTHSPANLVTMCQSCHMHVESEPEESLRWGYRVPQHEDPATTSVWLPRHIDSRPHQDRRFLLHHDGTTWPA